MSHNCAKGRRWSKNNILFWKERSLLCDINFHLSLKVSNTKTLLYFNVIKMIESGCPSSVKADLSKTRVLSPWGVFTKSTFWIHISLVEGVRSVLLTRRLKEKKKTRKLKLWNPFMTFTFWSLETCLICQWHDAQTNGLIQTLCCSWCSW